MYGRSMRGSSVMVQRSSASSEVSAFCASGRPCSCAGVVWKSHISGRLVVREDAAKFSGHGVPTDHLASIEAHNEALGSEYGTHRVGIAGVPAVDQLLIQAPCRGL